MLARDIQRERAALVERSIGGADIEDGSGQRFVEPAGLQHRSVRVRLGLTRRQLFRRCFGRRPHDAVLVDAEERLDERGAIEAEEHLLFQPVTRYPIGIQGGRDLVGDLLLQCE